MQRFVDSNLIDVLSKYQALVNGLMPYANMPNAIVRIDIMKPQVMQIIQDGKVIGEVISNG